MDRRLTLREILEKVFGLIPRFKSKYELLEEEFAKFVADTKPDEATAIPAIKTYFKAYMTSGRVRDIVDSRQFTELATIRSSPRAISWPCRSSTARSCRSTSKTTCLSTSSRRSAKT